MFEELLRYLAVPGSHAVTLVIGMAIVYRFVVLPERKRADRVEHEVNEIFQAHRDALNRIK